MFGLMAWLVWVLIFFAGTVKGNVPHNQLFKLTKAAYTPAKNEANLPSNASEPLQLPEDSECFTSEVDDELDDQKKSTFAVSVIQLFTLHQTAEIQSVQSFQYHQSRKQVITVPLFVLHHSWKSYLF